METVQSLYENYSGGGERREGVHCLAVLAGEDYEQLFSDRRHRSACRRRLLLLPGSLGHQFYVQGRRTRRE